MNLRGKAVAGVFWTFAQQFSVQLINFGVQIILARLLLPQVFGLIAMLNVFISIGQTLMDSGMTSSLIRTKEPDQLDYSTVFVTNIVVSTAVYLFVFLFAPIIAEFYNQDILKNILRVYALTFIIRSLVAVHIAKLTKEMDFKSQMKLQVPSTIVGASVGACMAYFGFGVWSLVWLNLSQTIVFTIQNWFFISWRPSFIFNKRRFKYHFNFGYKMTLSALLDTTYRNIYPIVVGKVYNPTIVGYFNQAETMRQFPIKQLSAVMGKVTYPLFSNLTNDIELKKAYKAAMKLVFFVVIPVMMVLIVTGKELFLVLFGEKWLPAVPYFQILSIASIIGPLSTYNLNILKVKGRSDLFLKLELIKKGVGFLAVFLAVPFGMTVLVVSYMAVSHASTFVNMIYAGKLINYPFLEQLKDSSKLYLIGLICLGAVYLVKEIVLDGYYSDVLVLLISSLAYVILYALLTYLIDKDMIGLLMKVLKK